MSKQKEIEQTELATQNGEATGLALVHSELPTIMDAVEVTEKLAQIDSVDFSQGVNGNAVYWEASKGDVLTGVFRGWKVLTKVEDGKEKQIPAVVIATKTGEFLCGSMVITEAFLGRVTGCYVRIECTGKKDRTKMFEIKIV